MNNTAPDVAPAESLAPPVAAPDVAPAESLAPPVAAPGVVPAEAVAPDSRPDRNARRGEGQTLEAALQTVVADLLNDVPVAMRDLVPNLPPAEKALWIRQAVRKGLFASPPANSPDSRRPVARPVEDLNTLSPVAKMALGYK